MSTSNETSPSPKPAFVTVLVYDPPCELNPEDWAAYRVVPLDQYQNVLLVASQGQEIRFVAGQSNPTGPTGYSFGGDSKHQSPPKSP